MIVTGFSTNPVNLSPVLLVLEVNVVCNRTCRELPACRTNPLYGLTAAVLPGECSRSGTVAAALTLGAVALAALPPPAACAAARAGKTAAAKKAAPRALNVAFISILRPFSGQLCRCRCTLLADDRH